MAGLRRTLKKEQRKKLAEAAKKLKITIKNRRADGSVCVSRAWIISSKIVVAKPWNSVFAVYTCFA